MEIVEVKCVDGRDLALRVDTIKIVSIINPFEATILSRRALLPLSAIAS